MNDYYLVRLKAVPFSEEINDLLSAELAEIGFESFVTSEDALNAYIKASDFDEKYLKEVIDNFFIPCKITWEHEFIEGEDWNSEWEKNYFQPIVIGNDCVIHSSFHKNYPQCKYDILIDPKMAFGTGHHATTSMMVTHLLNYDLNDKIIIDMGTGTGILSILSKLRGAERVIGIEIDPPAYLNAIENASLNKQEVEFLNGDANALVPLPEADIFLANINRNVILEDLKFYQRHIKTHGLLILSGFYEQDVPLLIEAAKEYGLDLKEKMMQGDWCSLVLVKKEKKIG